MAELRDHGDVIQVAERVMRLRRFAAAIPAYRPCKPCVYVACTALMPEERFAQQQAGIRANRYARRYGLRLRPRNFCNYGPYATCDEAEAEERYRANRLRQRGYGFLTV